MSVPVLSTRTARACPSGCVAGSGRPFEESEWESDPPAASLCRPRGGRACSPSRDRREPTRPPQADPLLSPRKPGGRCHPRRHLLATLRRLQNLAPPRGWPLDGDDLSDSEPSPRRVGFGGARRQPKVSGTLQLHQQVRLAKKRGSGYDEMAAGEGSLVSHEKPRGAGASRVSEEPQQQLTRKQWRNRQKNKRRQKNKFKAVPGQDSLEPDCRGPLGPPRAEDPPEDRGGLAPETEASGGRAQSLRQHLENRLDAARFRYVNQQLYTWSSQEAAQFFQEDPEALAIYHRGFALQAARWPERPVQRFVRYLRRRPPSLVVADFGCGDCALAHSLPNQVHCFDLLALDPRVTVCDMAQVPLQAASVDVAVFCLALMGTNLREILQEAHRVLRTGGTLLVAEVASRFADVRAFVGALARLGFRLVSKDLSGSHFYTFELRKAAAAEAAGKEELRGLALRPCLYKRR